METEFCGSPESVDMFFYNVLNIRMIDRLIKQLQVRQGMFSLENILQMNSGEKQWYDKEF